MSSSYLKSIEARLNAGEAGLLRELEQAFDQAPADSPAKQLPRARELHELVRFCNFVAIAPWLQNERDALVRVLAFARKIGAAEVARILSAALEGSPQPDVEFSLTLPGQTPIPLEDPSEITLDDEKDWDSTDLALGQAIQSMTDVVLHEVVSAADEFDLPPPRTARART
jgi:hypothetical protein